MESEIVRMRKRDNSPEGELRQYMLGEVSEQEQQRYEERLLRDDQLFREVDGMADRVQDELAEDYVSGDLTNGWRRAFEQRLLPCTGIRQKMQLHEALRALAFRKRRQRSWMERFGLWFHPLLRPVPALAGALLFVVVAGGSWSVYQLDRLQRQVDEAASRQALLTASEASLRRQLDEQLQRTLEAMKSRGTMDIASIILRPGLQRSGGAIPQVDVASGQRVVELRLDVGLDDYPSYQVAVFGSSGEKVLEQHQLKATRAGESVYIVFELPTKNLRGDDYQATLSGMTASRQVETIDRYYFRLIAR